MHPELSTERLHLLFEHPVLLGELDVPMLESRQTRVPLLFLSAPLSRERFTASLLRRRRFKYAAL